MELTSQPACVNLVFFDLCFVHVFNLLIVKHGVFLVSSVFHPCDSMTPAPLDQLIALSQELMILFKLLELLQLALDRLNVFPCLYWRLQHTRGRFRRRFVTK